MSKVKYSIYVDAPSKDVDPIDHEIMHLVFALQSLDSLYQLSLPQLKGPEAHEGAICPSVPFPYHIIKYFMACEDAGHYRAELLEGTVIYKMYIKPDDNTEN